MSPKAIFDLPMQRVHTLIVFYEHLSVSVQPILDCSDLLRSALMLCVSALDQYIHETTVAGMMLCWNGSKPQTESFKKYALSIAIVKQLLDTNNSTCVELAIRENLSFLTFQQPDKIAAAIRLFSTEELWPSVAALLGIDTKDLKSELELIIRRRNKIAHEADLDPSYPGQMWPIDKNMVEASSELIKIIVGQIELLVG